jgi:hypothetical protein
VGVLVLAGIAAFGLRAESASDPLDQLKPGERYEVPNSKLQGNAVGFDVGNNVMMLYGGRGGSVFWLYRYGNGAEPDTPAR